MSFSWPSWRESVRLLVERIDLSADGMEVQLRAEVHARRGIAVAGGQSGMRANRKLLAENWEFDGNTITVRIPMTWKRVAAER